MAKNKSNETKIISTIYPIISAAISKKKGAHVACIERFVHKYHEQLYDYAPIDRIFFGKNEVNDFFKSIAVDEDSIHTLIKDLYYYDAPELQACKDPFSISQLMIVKYYIGIKDKKNMELSCMYLAFSGKFYASCHYKWFREFVPKREVMDYVINYMLSKKFDLVTEGSVWGAIRNLITTWMESYKNILTSSKSTDEEFVYIIHQLHERIYAFLRNIAKPYYTAYEKKLYLNYESDNYDTESGGKYRVTQNNNTIAVTITEKTISYMTSSSVNITRCHAAASKGVDPSELKSIFENIMNNNKALDELRTIINILIVDFMKNYPNVKDVTNSVEFIEYSIALKPNTKNKDLLYLKNTIIEWLNTSSRYRSIKTLSTKNNYYKGILIYIVLTVNASNKGD